MSAMPVTSKTESRLRIEERLPEIGPILEQEENNF